MPDWIELIGREQRRAAGGTTVGHVDELQTGEAQLGHHHVGRAGGLAATEGELDVAPGQPGVGQRPAHGNDSLVDALHAVVTAELVHPDADDRNVVGHDPPPAPLRCRPAESADRAERERDHLVAVVVHVERVDGQLHLHADLQLVGIGQGESRLHQQLAVHLQVADPERLVGVRIDVARDTAAPWAGSPGSSRSTTCRVRPSSTVSVESPLQRGQSFCTGNVWLPQSVQRLPSRTGRLAGPGEQALLDGHSLRCRCSCRHVTSGACLGWTGNYDLNPIGDSPGPSSGCRCGWPGPRAHRRARRGGWSRCAADRPGPRRRRAGPWRR